MTKFFSVLRYHLLTRQGFREMVRDIHESAKSDNRFGYKCLVVCGLVIVGQIVYQVRFYNLFNGF